jgi:hypothetical protein
MTTRAQALLWCHKNNADTNNVVFPPPEGWMWWSEEGSIKGLSAIFTRSEQSDITQADIDIFNSAYKDIENLGETEHMRAVLAEAATRDDDNELIHSSYEMIYPPSPN